MDWRNAFRTSEHGYRACNIILNGYSNTLTAIANAVSGLRMGDGGVGVTCKVTVLV